MRTIVIIFGFGLNTCLFFIESLLSELTKLNKCYILSDCIEYLKKT